MEKLNITQLNKLQKEEAQIELRSFSTVISVDEHNHATTKVVWRAIVNGKIYEITAGTAKKFNDQNK